MRRQVMQILAVRGWALIAGVLAGILTARALGPSGRGIYYLGVTVAGIATQFGNLGLQSSNTILVSGEHGRARSANFHSLLLSVVGLGSLSIILFVSLPWERLLPDVPERVIALGLALAVPSLYTLFGLNLLVATRRVGMMNIVEGATRALIVLAFLAVAIWAPSPTAFLVTSAAVGVLTMLWLAWLIGVPPNLQIDADLAKRQLRFGVRAYILSITGYIVLRGNAIIVSYLASPYELGLYSVAAQVAEYMGMFPTAVAMMLLPELVRMGAGRRERMNSILKRVGFGMLIVCAAAALLGRLAIEFAFGAAYLDSYPILLALLPAVFFLALTSIVSQYLNAEGIPRTQMVVWTLAALGSLALSFTLTSLFGVLAAAFALSVSYAGIFCAIYAYSMRRQSGVINI